MRQPWRYKLPCGHHTYHWRHENPPERRIRCANMSCMKFFAEDDLIDKLEEKAEP